MRTGWAAAILGWAAMAAAAPASAEIVGFEFTGTITYSTYMAPVGSRITGHFFYELETSPSADARPPEKQVSGYRHYHLPPPYRMTAQVNGHTVVGGTLFVDIFNDAGGNTGDMIDVSGGYPVVIDGTTFANGTVGFRLASGSATTDPLSGTDLPRSFRVSEFAGENHGWVQMDGGLYGTLVQFRVDAIHRAAPRGR